MIVDSGNRTTFASGAVRDVPEGKGRCDLLPLDVIGEMYCQDEGEIFTKIALFQKTGSTNFLSDAIFLFIGEGVYSCFATAILEVAIHFEEGAKKYGDRNWEKGIPVQRFIDSGVRHYLKYLRGDTDERHDRAFVWNMMCAIWTCKHHPALNEYAKRIDNADRCILCDEPIPEGRHTCPNCDIDLDEVAR
jgi:hypothetical protein